MSAVPAQDSQPSCLLIGSRAEPGTAADEVSVPLRSLSEGLLDLLVSSSSLTGRHVDRAG